MTTPVVSIAFHSGHGHTAVLAEAVRSGAAGAGASVMVERSPTVDDHLRVPVRAVVTYHLA